MSEIYLQRSWHKVKVSIWNNSKYIGCQYLKIINIYPITAFLKYLNTSLDTRPIRRYIINPTLIQTHKLSAISSTISEQHNQNNLDSCDYTTSLMILNGKGLLYNWKICFAKSCVWKDSSSNLSNHLTRSQEGWGKHSTSLVPVSLFNSQL